MAEVPVQFDDRAIRLAAEALRAEGATEVYVFGSAARGSMKPGSDIDLAVRGLPPARFFRALARASRAAACDVDVVDLDRDTIFIRVLKQFGELRRVG